MEYKVGDRVRVITDIYNGNNSGEFNMNCIVLVKKGADRDGHYLCTPTEDKEGAAFFAAGDLEYPRIKNTKIAKKLNQGKIIRETEEWLYLR